MAATLAEIYNFFRDDKTNLAQFRKEWTELSDTDKEQIRAGLSDETLTY